MAQKFNSLDRESKNDIEDTLESASASMGIDSWDSGSTNYRMLEDQVGICSNCKSLQYCRAEFGNVMAVCSTFEIRLHGH